MMIDEAEWPGIAQDFFDRDALVVAKNLIGCVLRVRHPVGWLAARIIETEAYLQKERGSHASLGRSPSREALFMEPGTIYMYYARGGDSLNFSVRGQGNAVLIKSAFAWPRACTVDNAIGHMQKMNPINGTRRLRDPGRLCSGQTLLCRSLGLRVPDWNGRRLDPDYFYVAEAPQRPGSLIQTSRLGIPAGRDEHLPYRFIDNEYVRACTRNPITRRDAVEGHDYWRVENSS